MKKVIIPLILLLAVTFLIAVESDPSETVGYVKYDLYAGSNLIALPMQSGYATSSDLGDAIGATSISNWDASSQSWNQYVTGMFGWSGSFTLADGMGIMLNVTAAGTFYCAGSMITQPNYNLEVGSNLVMIPLDRSDLLLSSTVGDEIGATSISSWNASSQSWNQYVTGMFGWSGSFDTDIAMPFMVNVTTASTWPAPEVRTMINSNSNFQSSHGRAFGRTIK